MPALTLGASLKRSRAVAAKEKKDLKCYIMVAESLFRKMDGSSDICPLPDDLHRPLPVRIFFFFFPELIN